MNKLKTKRWARSLITTCAASIQVTEKERQSVNDFVEYALQQLSNKRSGYSQSGNQILFVKDFSVDVANTEAEDHLNLTDETAERLMFYVNVVKGEWFSQPNRDLYVDLTDPDELVIHLLLGTALSLVPWKQDNTFELQMHGQQITSGRYELTIVDFFVFDERASTRLGICDAVCCEIEYELSIVEGMFRGKRKIRARKDLKLQCIGNELYAPKRDLKRAKSKSFDQGR